MKKQYSKEEKAAYYAGLRARWEECKRLAGSDDMQRAYLASGATVSVRGWCWVYQQMQDQGLSGWPVIDALTFGGWRDRGFMVRKGEHSTISGLTWLECQKKESEKENDHFFMPKVYALFHRSQVEPIAAEVKKAA